jgi:hypothetical protein
MLDDTYERIDPRTMTLRCGLVVQSTVAAEILRAMIVDLETALHETEFDNYLEIHALQVRLDTIADLADKSPLAGLPQMDSVTDQAIIDGMDALDAFTAPGTYYGWHKEAADCLGVWLDWEAIDKSIAEEKLSRPDGVWAYVRILNDKMSSPTVFNTIGDQVDNDQLVDDAAFEGRVFEIDAETKGHFLLDMEEDNLICVSATSSSLVFAA